MSRISMIGDWDRVRRIAQNINNDMEDAASKSLKQIGLVAEKISKQHISRQDLKWEPLKSSYKKRKRKQGYSTKTLVRTSTYFQAITSFTTGNSAHAGVKRSAKSKEGEELANIARVHEFGSPSRNIPARPLWRPTFQETKQWISEKKPFLTELMKKSNNYK